jgi:hypothetical protein
MRRSVVRAKLVPLHRGLYEDTISTLIPADSGFVVCPGTDEGVQTDNLQLDGRYGRSSFTSYLIAHARRG